ncbi:MAG: hypothetical protein E4G71_05215 [Candidatus Atribacteria bacterium]|nr:MAG: hypothetical protein E4G71_05215 [Candidatus Atribacteria bacterium]
MKKLVLIAIVITLFLANQPLQAQIVVPLGKGNFALKFDYIAFTDDFFDKLGNEDDGVYIGLEGYGKITTNFYLGGEIGQGGNITLFGEDIIFVPIEVNVKYANEFGRNFVIDLGVGLSYSYAELTNQFSAVTTTEERNDWMFGGQIFTDLNYKINWLSIGLNFKYQITEGFKDEDLNLSNFRLGAQIGVMF